MKGTPATVLPAGITIGDTIIRQDLDGRYCLNDLHKASGGEAKHRPNYWINNQQTIDLIMELKAGIPALEQNQPVSVIHGGNSNGTYVVKELVYAYAMWISPSFHLKVIRTFDQVVTTLQPEPDKALNETLMKAIAPVTESLQSIAPMLQPALIDPATDLIVITDGEPRTTTLAIAEGTGAEHASVVKLVRNYQRDVEEFGLVRFEIRPRPKGQHGGGDVEYALLNEPQATLIISFMRNSEIVRGFKKRLVKAFYELKAKVETAPSAFQVPKSFSEALLLAAAQQEQIEQQSLLIEQKDAMLEGLTVSLLLRKTLLRSNDLAGRQRHGEEQRRASEGLQTTATRCRRQRRPQA